MNTFRVWAIRESYYETEIEADSTVDACTLIGAMIRDDKLAPDHQIITDISASRNRENETGDEQT